MAVSTSEAGGVWTGEDERGHYVSVTYGCEMRDMEYKASLGITAQFRAFFRIETEQWGVEAWETSRAPHPILPEAMVRVEVRARCSDRAHAVRIQGLASLLAGQFGALFANRQRTRPKLVTMDTWIKPARAFFPLARRAMESPVEMIRNGDLDCFLECSRDPLMLVTSPPHMAYFRTEADVALARLTGVV